MSGRMGEWSLKLPFEDKPIKLQPSMIFVGRSECDIVVNSTTVDKRHAVIYFNQQDQQFHIKDLNTLSGTYVNGTRIPEQSYVKLENGDQIRFGYHKQNYEMQLVTDVAVPPTTPMDDDDSLNDAEERQPIKGTDSLEDVCDMVEKKREQLQKNRSLPQMVSPTSPHSDGVVPPKTLPLNGMVSSYCAPARSPSEPQIDNKLVASLWDQSPKKRSPSKKAISMTISVDKDLQLESPPESNNQMKQSEENGAQKEKAQAFVINFDEPKRRTSIPYSILQRRDLAAAKSKDEDGKAPVTDNNEEVHHNGHSAHKISDSANFLIQKMLQSNNDAEIHINGGEEAPVEEDRLSETGTYTVDDPAAREARGKIDQVFGVGNGVAYNDFNSRTRNLSKNKHNVPVTRTQPMVVPPRRNRIPSSTNHLASSVPNASCAMTDSMISSTISSGSSTGGLPSKPSSVIRAKTTTPTKPPSGTVTKPRRPSSSGVSRPTSGKSTSSASTVIPRTDSRPPTARSTTVSSLRRTTYSGSDFSLESSNSSVAQNPVGETMKVNRAFALRRARLGIQDNVVSQKAHLLTGSNPNLFSRQDGGRFSMRLPSAKQRTRPGMESFQQSALKAQNRHTASPTTRRRNESDPCNINLVGQEEDDFDDERPELRNAYAMDPLSQSTFEPSTQDLDALKEADMCRSASFNAHPVQDRRAASPLLQRKETFLKQRTPQPQSQVVTNSKPGMIVRPSGRTASPSRGSFSPQLQRRTMGSPQISRKVLPSPQVNSLLQTKPSFGERDEPQGLSALDQLVVQAISQLSGKLRLKARSLVERESTRYPEGSDSLILIQELLSTSPAGPPMFSTGEMDISKELSSILRNLRKIDQMLCMLSALEPPAAAPIEEEVPEEIEDNLPDAESLGDKVPTGFFTVAL